MQTLDKYQILEKIGVGGFGVVYKATDPFIKRFVAIKTCTSADPETRQRFLREAEIAGNLHHRNIVTVYDFGFQEETPYLVQEYLTGEDLDHKIRRHEFLPMPTKVLYLVQIARGLDYAHRNGVIHRDIKPANIRILDDDTAKIMDFGIARLLQQQQGLTQAGITLGTAAYLAPEQIKGESCDARTDIFSFGALAYELVSGERPFGGADISAVFYRILNDEVPPLRKAVPECPFDLEKIVMRCLEKEPQKRFPTSQDLLKALEELAKRRGSIDTATAIPMRRPAAAAMPTGTTTAPLAAVASAAEAATAPATAASATGAAAAAPPAARPRSFDDFVLDTPHPGDGSKSDGLDTVAFRRHRGGGLYKIAAALALVAAGAWIALRMRGAEPAAPAPLAATTAASPTSTAPPPSAAPPATASDSAPAAAASGPTIAGTPGGAAAEPAPADPAASVAPEPPPIAAEPPKPEPAVLVVEPGWDSAITVRLGKKSWPLDRERRFELEPGSYKLRFAIANAAYSHEEEVTVRLEEGATRRVAVPLERPGRLTVQPHLNTPQGFVRLDGAAAGPTPLRGRWLSPGSHVVAIASSPDPGAPVAFTESVEIASDRETLLTFDLSGKQERKVSSRSALPN